MKREKKMEMTETMQLTKEQNLMELLELLRKNNMKEAANSIFEMAAYVDVMEKKDGFCSGGTCDGQRPAS